MEERDQPFEVRPEDFGGFHVPTDVPLPDDPDVLEGDPVFRNPVEFSDYADCAGYADGIRLSDSDPTPPLGQRAIAIAEPLRPRDASVVALGDNVRQMTQLIESVGRTLEAQNQRAVRLMEKLEAVARSLESMPEEADRNLEALDAVQESIQAQQKPLESIDRKLGDVPDMVRAMRENTTATRELWNVATRAMAGRMAHSAYEEGVREHREGRKRRWRVLGSALLAMAAFAGGTFLADRVADLTALLAPVRAVEAREGEPAWKPVAIRRVQEPPPPAPAPAADPDIVLPFGVDEEEGR